MPDDTVAMPSEFEPSVLGPRYEIPLQWEASVDSTNARLLAQPWPEPGKFASQAGFACCLVADHQSAGRGRQRKVWYDEPGSCVLMSLSIDRYQRPWPPTLGAFSIASAVCLINKLEMARKAALDPGNNCELRLKWPNDVVWFREGEAPSKLAGILIETRQQGDFSRLVIGLGVNLIAPDLPATDPQSLAAGGLFSASSSIAAKLDRPWRLAFASTLSQALLHDWMRFESEGLKPFAQAIAARDLFRDKPVVFQEDAEAQWFEAIGDGIELDGQLRLRYPGRAGDMSGRQRFSRGSVRLLIR